MADTSIIISYDEIKERCKLLSSYEAQSAKNASGDTMYMDIVMTEKEDALIVAHSKEASRLIESRLNTSLDIIVDSDDSSTVTVGTSTSTGYINITVDEDFDKDAGLNKRNSFRKSFCETIVAYVLSHWLMDKTKLRGDAYQRMYEQMVEATRIIGLKRGRPKYTVSTADSSASERPRPGAGIEEN